jgi:acyl-coenzyme A thioesterase PaaI-like protein
LKHHDLCFGCGQANLFGLQMEAGRFFVKQDHQGPDGAAHPGILATALAEAMLLAGQDVTGMRIELRAPAPVGEFVEIEATPAGATARCGGEVVAECRT